MNMRAGVLGALFILLHGAGGQPFYVSPSHITSLREPVPADRKQHFPSKTRCIISTTDTKILAVQEDCADVRNMIK